MKTPHTKLLSLALLLFISLPLTGFAADEEESEKCVPPQKTPAVPDGRRASEEQMKEAMSDVREYLGYSAAFRQCIERLLVKQGGAASEKIRQGATALIQESSDTDELLGSLFNQQVRIYKSLNPPD